MFEALRKEDVTGEEGDWNGRNVNLPTFSAYKYVDTGSIS